MPDHGRHRRHRWPVGRPGRLRRHHRNRARLRHRSAQARRGSHRKQQGGRTTAAPRRKLGRGDRKGQRPRGARRERGRAVGEAERAHGRPRASTVALAASLPGDGVDTGSRGTRLRGADDGGSRGLHLHAPGPARGAGRHLRDQPPTLEHRWSAMGLRHGAHPRGDRPHRGRARNGLHPLSRAAESRSQTVGERGLHLLSRRQPAGRPGVGVAQLLARLRGHGRLPPGRRGRQIACGVDDPRRSGGGTCGRSTSPATAHSPRTASTSARPRASSTPGAS